MEFKEFKRVYVGPNLLYQITGVGGPFETGEVVIVTEQAAKNANIASEQHFDDSYPGLFEKPGSKLAKEAMEAREKGRKGLKSAPDAVDRVVAKGEAKAEEKADKATAAAEKAAEKDKE